MYQSKCSKHRCCEISPYFDNISLVWGLSRTCTYNILQTIKDNWISKGFVGQGFSVCFSNFKQAISVKLNLSVLYFSNMFQNSCQAFFLDTSCISLLLPKLPKLLSLYCSNGSGNLGNQGNNEAIQCASWNCKDKGFCPVFPSIFQLLEQAISLLSKLSAFFTAFMHLTVKFQAFSTS